MALGNYQSGWNSQKSGEKKGEDRKSTASDAEKMFKYQCYIPRPSDNKIEAGKPITHRFMFITDIPFNVYMHSMWEFKATNDLSAICLKKNDLWKECPACSAATKLKYPFYNGYFQLIDMGQVQYSENGKVADLHHYSKEYEKDGVKETRYFRFPKKVIGLRNGTAEKPGRMQLVHNEISKRGHGMFGTVWDVTRNGEKSDATGDSWTFIARVTKDQMEAGLKKYGAKDEEIDLEALPWNGPGGIFNIEDPEEYYEKMCEMVGWQHNQKREKAKTEGAGFGDSYESSTDTKAEYGDDDIPF